VSDIAVPTETLRAGYVFLPRMLDAAEVAELRTAAEEALATVVKLTSAGDGSTTVWPDGHRLQDVRGVTVHWEPETADATARSIAPVTDLDPRFAAFWSDPRLTRPMSELLGASELGPFTSKLNFKRGRIGSEFNWHQDYPFWHCRAGLAGQQIGTVMIFLDDADADNGAMHLLPGSHLVGPVRRDPTEPTRLLVDPTALDVSGEVVVDAPAGSVLMFPSLMVHRSGPNRSDSDRRALLLCFQPAGRPALHELRHDATKLDELP
jgi:Phytanoyl-CoA dioxygenase (PhyH)